MAQRISQNSNLIKALEVFIATSETGQVTQAAKLLGMTQSAVSQQIATLEHIYKAELLDRSVRPIKLTPAGDLFLRHAQRILNAVEDLSMTMRHQGQQPISVLRVGMLASIATTLTPALVMLAKSDFGVEDLTLHAGQSDDHEVLLRTKKADLIITSNPFYDMDGLERHAVLTEDFLLVLPQDYHGPASSLRTILDKLPLVRFAATTHVGRRTEQHLRRLRLSVPRVIQADRSSMVTACVASGLGFTILTPSLLIDGFVEQMPLKIMPLHAPGFSRSITVVARDGELSDLPSKIAAVTALSLAERVQQQMGTVGISALHIDRVLGDMI